MIKQMRTIVVLVMTAIVTVMAVWVAMGAEIAPEVVDTWNSEEMPVKTRIGSMLVHIPLGIYVWTLGMGITFLVWHCLSDKMRLHWLTFGLIACGGLMIAVGKWPHAMLGWDEDIHRMWVYLFSGWDQYTVSEYIGMYNTWFFGYIPYTMSMWIGRMLSLPESWALRLCFCTGVLSYAAISAAAVRITPRYKLTFMIASMLPTCLLQASNISYDAITMAGALLGMAFFVRELDTHGEIMSANSAVAMTTSIALGTLAKPAYSLLLLCLWLLPESKFISKSRKWIFRLIVLFVLLLCTSSSLLGMYDEQMLGDIRMGDTDSIGQWRHMQENPYHAFEVFGSFFAVRVPRLLMMAASEWAHWGSGRNSAKALILVLAVLCPLYCSNEKRTALLTWKRRTMLLILSLLPVLALAVVQYLVSTPVGSDAIAGMQSRYLLPVIPCLCLTAMLPQRWRNWAEPAGRWIVLLAAGIAIGCVYVDGWQFMMVDMQGVLF